MTLHYSKRFIFQLFIVGALNLAHCQVIIKPHENCAHSQDIHRIGFKSANFSQTFDETEFRQKILDKTNQSDVEILIWCRVKFFDNENLAQKCQKKLQILCQNEQNCPFLEHDRKKRQNGGARAQKATKDDLDKLKNFFNKVGEALFGNLAKTKV